MDLKLIPEISRSAAHFVGPIVNRLFVVDLLSQPSDERAWCPNDSGRLLLYKHGVQNRGEPILKLAVVVIWDNEISDAIHALLPQFGTVQVEIRQVSLTQTFDKVLFYPTCCCDESSHMSKFDKMENDLAQSRRNQIGGVTQKDVTASIGPDSGIQIFLDLVV